MATSEDFTIEGGTWLEIWDLAAQRRESASPATVLPSLVHTRVLWAGSDAMLYLVGLSPDPDNFSGYLNLSAWDADTGLDMWGKSFPGQIIDEEAIFLAAAASPDGRILATSNGLLSGSGRLYYWDTDSVVRIAELDTAGIYLNAAFSPDGKRLGTISPSVPFKALEIGEDWSSVLQVWEIAE